MHFAGQLFNRPVERSGILHIHLDGLLNRHGDGSNIQGMHPRAQIHQQLRGGSAHSRGRAGNHHVFPFVAEYILHAC